MLMPTAGRRDMIKFLLVFSQKNIDFFLGAVGGDVDDDGGMLSSPVSMSNE